MIIYLYKKFKKFARGVWRDGYINDHFSKDLVFYQFAYPSYLNKFKVGIGKKSTPSNY